jgi:hypothetical protein
MNTQTFFRSTHFLQQDSFGWPFIISWLITAVLLAWAGWFFLMPFTLYEVSQTAAITPNNQVTATFPANVLLYARPGQTAQLELEQLPALTYGTVPLQIAHIQPQAAEGWIVIEFTIDPDSTLPHPAGLNGTVHLPLHHLTPAQYTWQTLVR